MVVTFPVCVCVFIMLSIDNIPHYNRMSIILLTKCLYVIVIHTVTQASIAIIILPVKWENDAKSNTIMVLSHYHTLAVNMRRTRLTFVVFWYC